jgi:hypothetical protein
MPRRGFNHTGLSTLDLDRMPAGGGQSMTGARATIALARRPRSAPAILRGHRHRVDGLGRAEDGARARADAGPAGTAVQRQHRRAACRRGDLRPPRRPVRPEMDPGDLSGDLRVLFPGDGRGQALRGPAGSAPRGGPGAGRRPPKPAVPGRRSRGAAEPRRPGDPHHLRYSVGRRHMRDRGGQSGLAGHLLCRRAGADGAGPDRRLRPPRVTGLSRGAPVGAADGGGARRFPLDPVRRRAGERHPAAMDRVVRLLAGALCAAQLAAHAARRQRPFQASRQSRSRCCSASAGPSGF